MSRRILITGDLVRLANSAATGRGGRARHLRVRPSGAVAVLDDDARRLFITGFLGDDVAGCGEIGGSPVRDDR